MKNPIIRPVAFVSCKELVLLNRARFSVRRYQMIFDCLISPRARLRSLSPIKLRTRRERASLSRLTDPRYSWRIHAKRGPRLPNAFRKWC